jgi:hypothetical protein
MENWFKKRFKKLSKVPFNKEDVLKKNMEDWLIGWTSFIVRNTHVRQNGLTIRDGSEWYEYMWDKWLHNTDLGKQYLEKNKL